MSINGSRQIAVYLYKSTVFWSTKEERELGDLREILVGYSSLKSHLLRMLRNDCIICKSCEEDNQTREHFLYFSLAFTGIRADY